MSCLFRRSDASVESGVGCHVRPTTGAADAVADNERHAAEEKNQKTEGQVGPEKQQTETGYEQVPSPGANASEHATEPVRVSCCWRGCHCLRLAVRNVTAVVVPIVTKRRADCVGGVGNAAAKSAAPPLPTVPPLSATAGESKPPGRRYYGRPAAKLPIGPERERRQ